MKNTNCLLLLFMICEILLTIQANAQWTQINLPENVFTNCLATKDTFVFAGTYYSGIFSSTDNGTTWNEKNTGLTNKDVHIMLVNETYIYAGTSGGVFLSTDNGDSWTAINNGLTESYIWSLAASDTNLYAGTNVGVFRADKMGSNWKNINSELTTTIIRSIVIRDSFIFAGAYDRGVFLSTNSGDKWIEAREGMFNGYVRSLALIDTVLFAGTWGGVFISTDNALNWTEASEGLTFFDIRALAVWDTILFAGSWEGGAFYSTNKATGWIETSTGLTNKYVAALAVNNEYIFASTLDDLLWRRPLSETITTLEQVHESATPMFFSLEQNYPNPFNPATTIEFQIPNAEFVTLKIYTILGEEVATLVNKNLPAGSHMLYFDGHQLASGIYLCKLQAGRLQKVKKMVLFK